MSLQRVFESARKLGLPVVVTDPSGREPFVLLPLDQFEALTGETERQQPKSEKLGEIVSEEKLEKELYVAKKEQSSLSEKQPITEASSEPELLAEERFYLGQQGRES